VGKDSASFANNANGAGEDVAAPSIEGTWRATSLAGASPPAPSEGLNEPLLTLRPDGTFLAFDSCITVDGRFDFNNDAGSLKFTTTRQRLVLCEPHYAHPLDAAGFEVTGGGGELVLFASDGHKVATYVRVKP
jgi:hypothetical protein